MNLMSESITLKEKQDLYERFKSKVGSACIPLTYIRSHEKNIEVNDEFIDDEIIPLLWDNFEKKLNEVLSNTPKKS